MFVSFVDIMPTQKERGRPCRVPVDKETTLASYAPPPLGESLKIVGSFDTSSRIFPANIFYGLPSFYRLLVCLNESTSPYFCYDF